MSRALLKFVRVSPTKARLIAREVQGMNAELALAALEFMPNKAAGIISKVIASAVANGDYEPEEVTITSCRVDKAAVMKRWRPRARGTASRILKPTSHILVEIGVVSADAEAPAKKADSKKATSKKAAPKKEASKKAETKKAAPKAKAKSDAKGDDLTKVAGIGKVYQGKLNDEGIFTYADIVDMTQAQIDTMEEKYTFKGDFKDAIADAKNFVNGKDA
jgi:large subunit ribosomal protein L22